MNIDLAKTFVDGFDQPVMEKDAPITAKELLKRACLADHNGDNQPVNSDEKVKRFDLYMKIKAAEGVTNFEVDEVALLDKAVRVFPTLILGQLHYLLSGK